MLLELVQEMFQTSTTAKCVGELHYAVVKLVLQGWPAARVGPALPTEPAGLVVPAFVAAAAWPVGFLPVP